MDRPQSAPTVQKYRYHEDDGTSPRLRPHLHHHPPCPQHPMGPQHLEHPLHSPGPYGRPAEDDERFGGPYVIEPSTLGRDGGVGECAGGWDGGTLGRTRSLRRVGSAGRPGELRGAELVQVAERQLSRIQHVHGYVTRAHIAPAQVKRQRRDWSKLVTRRLAK
ncbi:unnamed protein product [Knipowitschia caucasica]